MSNPRVVTKDLQGKIPLKDSAAKWIFQDVLDAMQNADEMGGPEIDGYIQLMGAIERVARSRKNQAKINRPDLI